MKTEDRERLRRALEDAFDKQDDPKNPLDFVVGDFKVSIRPHSNHIRQLRERLLGFSRTHTSRD